MRLLALDAAQACACAALLDDGVPVAERALAEGRGQAAQLAPLIAGLLAQARWRPDALELIAACVGPGSFTGLRASLAFAHGLAAALGVPLVGVTVAEALAAMLPVLPGREVWTALDSFRTGRVFLAAGGPFRAMLLSALPMPTGPVAVAGDAAGPVVATLSARGADVVLTEARRPQARHIGAVALLRARGHLPHLAPQPLYVDAPEAKLPAGGLRPAPQRAALSC